MSLFIKDPQSRVEYVMDWGALHLGVHTITGSEWAIDPQHEGGLAVVDHRHDGRATTLTLEGGKGGMVYDVTNRVTLSNGEIDERSLSFRVEQR